MPQHCIPRFPLEEQRVENTVHVTKSRNTVMPYDSIDPNLLSLAMGFVPKQIWETPYDAATALSRGTIFPSLDKPFSGWNSNQNKRGAKR